MNLKKNNVGANFYNSKASLSVQADDIALITSSCAATQQLVKICENYSIAWGVSFSPSKSKLLQFGKHYTITGKSSLCCRRCHISHYVIISSKRITISQISPF